MNQPMTAATTATIVPARNAFTMKWNSRRRRTSSRRFHVKPLSAMVIRTPPASVMGVDVGLSDHDEPAVGRFAARRPAFRTAR